MLTFFVSLFTWTRRLGDGDLRLSALESLEERDERDEGVDEVEEDREEYEDDVGDEEVDDDDDEPEDDDDRADDDLDRLEDRSRRFRLELLAIINIWRKYNQLLTLSEHSLIGQIFFFLPIFF